LKERLERGGQEDDETGEFERKELRQNVKYQPKKDLAVRAA
jgi:hypothetical protein